MTTFDIFIKGINPERANESDEIRVNAAKALQISVEKLDELLAHPNKIRIRSNALEQEAIDYQRALSKLGLICLYSPTKVLANLELEPLEEDFIVNSVICPNCEYEMAVEAEIEPEKCIECGIDIQKFLEQKRQQEEREAMKAKLLASQSILKAQEEKKLQEETEKQRKAELEKEVLQELGVSVEPKKNLNLKRLAISSSLIVAVAGIGYFLTKANTPEQASTQMQPVTAVGEEANLTQDNAISNTSQIVDGSLQPDSPLDAQQAMQKTHDQAAQVLNAFGLNADAFANNATTVSSNSQTNAAAGSQEKTILQNAATTPAIVNHSSVQKSEKIVIQTDFPELFAILKNDSTWDRFLAQNSKVLLENKKFEEALQLNKFIISNDVYIAALGELLRETQKSKQTEQIENCLAALNTRLEKLPSEIQVIYFASAAVHLPLENGTNSLFAKAENLLISLPKPELQLPAILKLAIAYFKAGNVANANNHFNKINALLISITDLDLQAKLRADVALAYQEIGDRTVSTQWLNSIEPLLKQLKPETISSITISYAKCNEWQKALNTLSLVNVTKRDSTLYRAIQTSLEVGLLNNGIELQKSLQSPLYNVLSNVLIAGYSPQSASFLNIAEQDLTKFGATEKILVTSQLVDYYGRLKNVAKTEEFLKISQDALANLPASNEKDALLEAVIEHYVHGFQFKVASNLLVTIQSTPLKMRLNIEINELTNVGTLLK